MKQIKEQFKEVGETAHTAGAEKVYGEGILPTSLQKFKDVESLCKAYNSLESEFTKRCQRIKELEGKLEKLIKTSKSDQLKSENAEIEAADNTAESAAESSDNTATVKAEEAEKITEKALSETEEPKQKTADNGTIAPLIEDDKGKSEEILENSAAESTEKELTTKQDFCKESEAKPNEPCDKTSIVDAITKPEVEKESTEIKGSSDGLKETVLGEVGQVLKFFKDYPESTARIRELEALCGGDYSLSSLQRAYIEILKKGEAQKARDVRETEGLTDAVKLMVIKDYLNSLRSERNPTLMGGSGVIPMTPPVRPKNIAEAGALAQNIIKIK